MGGASALPLFCVEENFMLMNQSAGGLLVPQHLVEDQKPPSSFVRRLQGVFGPSMHIEWNMRKQRWVIEECVGHHGSDQSNVDGVVVHTHLCARVYAWLVRDEETDSYMPLCDLVIEKLHEKETYRKYGTGEAALERFRLESARLDDEQKQKEEAFRKDVMKHNRKDNRKQWNWLYTMMKRHDMRQNKTELR
jgi:hypothetical protein